MAYLDHASGAPLHPVARATLLAASDAGWADPGRRYAAGRQARLILDDARERVAAALGARPAEVSFVPSGTAANQRALAGLLAARHRVGAHLVTSAVEHSSILRVTEAAEATVVAVDSTGQVDPDVVAAALRADTALASVQHANHEVGTLQPVAEVAERCRAAGVPLHVDAAQTVGRLPVDLGALGADVLTASAHKWGGPAGVGVLVVRTGVRYRADAVDERNVPAIAAAAAALEARLGEVPAENPRLDALVQRIRAEIPARVADVEMVGHETDRLPHLVTGSFLYVDGEAMLDGLDRLGFAVSSGSSCTADTLQPSHVLAAMGVLTQGNLRISLGRDTTEADVTGLLDAIPTVVADLRRLTGVGG